MKEIPEHETTDSVKNYLQDKGFDVGEVNHLYRKRDWKNNYFFIMQVKLPKTEANREISYLRFAGFFKVTVETQPTKGKCNATDAGPKDTANITALTSPDVLNAAIHTGHTSAPRQETSQSHADTTTENNPTSYRGCPAYLPKQEAQTAAATTNIRCRAVSEETKLYLYPSYKARTKLTSTDNTANFHT